VDFDLSDEQRLLKDSARRFVAERCSFDAWRQAQQQGSPSLGDRLWPVFADMGWLQLPFAADDGGLEGGPIDTTLLVQEMGRGLVAAGYVESVVWAGSMLRMGDRGPHRASRLASLMSGERRPAVAHSEPQHRFSLETASTQARRVADGWILEGHKPCVITGDRAQALIVSAHSPQGLSLFWVETDAPGVHRGRIPTVDSVGAADVHLQSVAVGPDSLIGEPGQGAALLKRAADQYLAAMGAEAVGLMDLLLELTVSYTGQRQQFGQPVARFQALRHRMVDMFMEVEKTRSLLMLATIRLAEGHPDAPRALSALKVQLGKGGRWVSQQAVQLHGGMGMSDEIAVGHAFKRLMVLDAQLGNVDHHLRRVSDLAGPKNRPVAPPLAT
jgi:alkylation response protein AidB-like acyl-CoA dehydrogenase